MSGRERQGSGKREREMRLLSAAGAAETLEALGSS